jgi:hypothetical protein
MNCTRILALLVVLAGLSACGWGGKDITSYDECVAAGHPQLESYPGQCVLPDGTRFVQSIPEPPSVCKDECGNGECQEMVCLGSGCPCSESPASCPMDCASP